MRITTSWPIAVVACVLILIGIGSNAAHAAFAPEVVAALSSRHRQQHRHQHHPDSRTTTILATTTSSGPGSATTGDSRDDKDECAPSKSPLLLSRRIFTTRSVVATATAVTSSSIVVPLLATLILTPEPAVAGIDMTSLTTTPIEGDTTGAASRRKQLQPTTPTTTTHTEGTVYLDNTGGVSYTEAYAGAAPGGRNRRIRNGVQKQFNVAADLRISTRTGLTLYSTRDDNQANELAWKVGTGDFPAGAEAGMLGMRLGSIRRIEVPSDLIFAARNAGTLPELTTTVGRERYEDLLRSGDATLIFDVRVTGINPGDSRI